MYREHPVTILKYSAKNIWLLIFPLLRGLQSFSLSSDFLYSWLKGAWFDIMILGFILVFGMLRWRFSCVKVEKTELIHSEGIFCRAVTAIPYKNICSLTIEKPFYYAPFGAVKFRCDTGSGMLGSADMKLTLSKRTCQAISKKMPDTTGGKSGTDIPKPTVRSVVLFSLFFSSGLSGAVYIAAFSYKGGDIALKILTEYYRRISEGTEMIAGSGAARVSDAAFGIGVFFLGAWLVSFVVNLLRYARFDVKMDKRCRKISYGVLTGREHRIMTEHVNYTDLRQNLIMKIWGAITVHISCPGYNGDRRSLPVLMPVRKKKDMLRELNLMGISSGGECDFRAHGFKNLWQYIWLPVLTATLSFPLHAVVSRLIPGLYDLTLFAAIMLAVPAVWMTAVKVGAFVTGGVSLFDDKLVVQCNSFTTFHTVIAERRKLVRLDIQQTIFQKRRHACSMVFRFEGEKKRRYKVKGISEKDAESIAALLDRD